MWEENYALASFLIGKKVSRETLALFGDRVAVIAQDKVFITGFLSFQYGKLSPDCRPHVKILELLAKHGIQYDTDNYVGTYTLYGRVSGTSNGVCNTHKEEEEDKDKDRKEGECREGGFSQFWSAYPKKLAKGDAEKAWKKQGCEPLLESILKKLEAFKTSDDWLKDGGQFIPYPATWINRKSWQDEVFTQETQEPKVKYWEPIHGLNYAEDFAARADETMKRLGVFTEGET